MVVKKRASINAKWLVVSAILLIAVAVTTVVLLGQAKKQSTEKRLVDPTSTEWLYTNGTWNKVDVPGLGEVMKGDALYGRRAKIETDSPIAVLKQRGIGGNILISVDGKQVVNQGLDGNGEVNEIPIYSNSKGWHQIEVIFSNRNSEIDGLYISKKAKVRKPEYNKKKLVVIGHSYAEGCCASNIATKSFSALVGDILGVESINQGIGRTDINVANGTTKDSGLDRVQTDVINLKPDYVLSVYGYNVIGRISGDMTHQKYQDDYTKFIKMINDALPQTKIFASGISSVPGRTEESLKPYNDDIKNACANALNCTFIDLTDKINESNYNKYIAANDGIHPNDEGHKFLAKEYAKVISSVIKK